MRTTALPLSAMPELGDPGAAFWWVPVNLVDKRGRDWISSLPQLPDEADAELATWTQGSLPDAAGRIPLRWETGHDAGAVLKLVALSLALLAVTPRIPTQQHRA